MKSSLTNQIATSSPAHSATLGIQNFSDDLASEPRGISAPSLSHKRGRAIITLSRSIGSQTPFRVTCGTDCPEVGVQPVSQKETATQTQFVRPSGAQSSGSVVPENRTDLSPDKKLLNLVPDTRSILRRVWDHELEVAGLGFWSHNPVERVKWQSRQALVPSAGLSTQVLASGGK